MKEILNFFKKRRSRIYACAIDASKAFDKVWRNGLFHKIIDKISDPEWRVIYNYYDISVCYIILNGQKSETFKTSVGVKQGGPMSPFLYNVYTQDLIIKIENLNSGPRIKELQISAIMYADDIMLMSTTRKGLEKMLKETASYLKEWKIKMNLNNTNYMVVGEERIHECPIIINNECIQRGTKIKYLGVTIDNKLNMKDHIENKNKQNSINAYSLYSIGLFNNNMNVQTKKDIYNTYCRPTLYYGWEFIEASEKNIKMIRNDEGILIKRMNGLNKKSKSTELYQALEIQEPIYLLYIMKIRLLARLKQNIITSNLLRVLEGQNTSGSIMNEITELQKIFEIENINKKTIWFLEKKIKVIETDESNNGLVDSIRFCLDERKRDKKYHKILYGLMKAF